jgi:hypothetical protein
VTEQLPYKEGSAARFEITSEIKEKNLIIDDTKKIDKI